MMLSSSSSAAIHILFQGFLVGTLNFSGTFLLERFCKDEVERLKKKKGGAKLYQEAIKANIINLIFILPLAYYVRVKYACYTGLSVKQQIQSMIGMVVLQSFFFYLVHKAFHEHKQLYWMHSFHHRFNDVILPSTACAVSVWEFVFAYLIPVILSSYLAKADRLSGMMANLIIGGSNVLIHCPFMFDYADKIPFNYADKIPFLASASDHFRHHRKLTTDYGAPVVHFDSVLDWASSTVSNSNVDCDGKVSPKVLSTN